MSPSHTWTHHRNLNLNFIITCSMFANEPFARKSLLKTNVLTSPRHQNDTFTFLHPLAKLPRWKQRRHILGARLGGKVQGRSRRILVVAIRRHRCDLFGCCECWPKENQQRTSVSTVLPKRFKAVEIRKIDSPEKRIKTDGKPKTLCIKSRCSTPWLRMV